QDNFKQHNERIFDSVPNNSFEMSGSKKAEQWYLTWIDLPIYTLWTTGTLYFSDNIKSPIFAEVPSGLMNYVAVSNPIYLFSPHMRTKLTGLNHEEQELMQQLKSSIRKIYKIDQLIEDEKQETLITEKQNTKRVREAKEKNLR